MWHVELTKQRQIVQYNNSTIGNVASVIVHCDAKRNVPELIIKIIDPQISIIAEVDDKNVKKT